MCSIPTQSHHVLPILNVNAERNATFVRLMAQFGSRQWLLCHPPECLAIGYGDLWFSCSVKANMSEWICDRHRDLKRFILIGHGFDLKSCDWIRRYWGALIAWGGVIYVPFGWKFFFFPMLCFVRMCEWWTCCWSTVWRYELAVVFSLIHVLALWAFLAITHYTVAQLWGISPKELKF